MRAELPSIISDVAIEGKDSELTQITGVGFYTFLAAMYA